MEASGRTCNKLFESESWRKLKGQLSVIILMLEMSVRRCGWGLCLGCIGVLSVGLLAKFRFVEG